MVPHRGAGAPQALEVARHGTGGVDHHVVRAHELVERAEHLGLGRQRPVPQVVALIGGALPGGDFVGDLRGPFLGHAVPVECWGECSQRLSRVADNHLSALLGRVEGADVDVHEAHVGVLELRLRRGGEVGVAGADADDEVGFFSQRVGRASAGSTDATHSLRVIPVDSSLAGLRVGHRDAGGTRQGAQLVASLGVDGAAAGNDERLRRRLDGLDGAGEGCLVGTNAPNVPHLLLEELQRPVVRLGLDVLGEADGDGAGVGRVGEYAHGARKGHHELLGAVHAVPEL